MYPYSYILEKGYKIHLKLHNKDVDNIDSG